MELGFGLRDYSVKAKKETTIFTLLTGSHLYGTATEKSDFDYKAVCLPSLDDLLLNTKVTNRKEKPEGSSASATMKAGETETEYVPLQVFLNDFFDGQTYALELVFASDKIQIDSLPLDMCLLLRQMFEELVKRFLTKNVKKMVGYAVSQSKMYGLKTQRYTTMGDALRTINAWGREHVHTNEQAVSWALVDCPTLVEQLLALPHVKSIEVLNANGGKDLAPGIEICNKQFPLTAKVHAIVKSLEKSISGYGERVKEFDGEGVDWKALSHAIRITEQVVELCETGNLTFPRPNAQFLLDVKGGKITLDEATAYLNSTFAKVDNAVTGSLLQERTPELELEFKEWKIGILRRFYGLSDSAD